MTSALANPLAVPRDHTLLLRFTAHFGIAPYPAGDPAQLSAIGRAFAQLPYENLSKIIRQSECGRPEAARRMPAEVLGDHDRWGTGGTCFALTATLLHMVRAAGWRAEVILADRRYGADTHCALLVWIEDRPHLLDPGYLIVEPLALPDDTAARRETPFNTVHLEPQAEHRVALHTKQHDQRTLRLTYKTAPVDDGQFLKAWDASFDWDMMQYPLLTRVTAGQQLYLQDRHFQNRTRDAVQRSRVDPEALPRHIAEAFAIHPQVVGHALRILRSREAGHGSGSSG